MDALMRYLLDPQFVVTLLAAVAASPPSPPSCCRCSRATGSSSPHEIRVRRARAPARRAHGAARRGSAPGQLRTEPKSFMQQMVEQLNLRKAFETEATRESLKMAGLRGQAPVVAYMFFRVGAADHRASV